MSAARRRTLAGSGRSLGEVVSSLGDAAAIDEGRVFVDGRRATDAARALRDDEIVDVYAARSGDEPARVLGEHGGIVVAYKPAWMASEPDKQGAAGSLLQEIAELCAVEPGALHVVSRLDVGVSGAVVMTRDAAPAPDPLERLYLGIAERAPDPERGSWSSAVRAKGRDLAALTRYETMARASSGAALLALAPETGRTHQLRIHASRAGLPLYGDRAHGGSARLISSDGSVLALDGIALHAIRVRGPGFETIAPVPERLERLWSSLGGDPRELSRVLESELGS